MINVAGSATLICGLVLNATWGLAFQNEARNGPGDRLFATTGLVRVELAMNVEEFEALQPSNHWGGERGSPFGAGQSHAEPSSEENPTPNESHRNTFGVELPWSRATLVVDGRTYPDVGIRYKGNFTLLATSGSIKRSMKIDLNRNVSGQKLDGLTKFNLHCGVSDPSLTREAFSYSFFRSVGVPTPRTVFAEVYLSVPDRYQRELVGVYTLVEQVNKTFLKQKFGDGSGMLLKPEGLQGGPSYLGPDWAAYEDKFKPDDEPRIKEKQRLIDFTHLISKGTDQQFEDEIGNYLDTSDFLEFIAANVVLSNLDSYLGFGHNYYMYLVPETNQFAFIPWDLDLSLASWPAVGTPEQLVKLSIFHPHAGDNRLLDRILAIPKFKEEYVGLIRQWTETIFTQKQMQTELREIEDLIRESRAAELDALTARKQEAARNGGPGGFGNNPKRGPQPRGAFGRGPGNTAFANGQFGQSLPPDQFIVQRIQSIADQLAGTTDGFVPQPFGSGVGGFVAPRFGRIRPDK